MNTSDYTLIRFAQGRMRELHQAAQNDGLAQQSRAPSDLGISSARGGLLRALTLLGSKRDKGIGAGLERPCATC